MEIKDFILQIEDSLDGLDPNSIELSTNFKSLKEWDSLAILTLTDTIDLNYGIILKKAEIESCSSVEELYHLVKYKSENK